MTGWHPPNVHAYCSGVGTNRVTAIFALIGRPPSCRAPSDHPSDFAPTAEAGGAIAPGRRVRQASGMREIGKSAVVEAAAP